MLLLLVRGRLEGAAAPQPQHLAAGLVDRHQVVRLAEQVDPLADDDRAPDARAAAVESRVYRGQWRAPGDVGVAVLAGRPAVQHRHGVPIDQPGGRGLAAQHLQQDAVPAFLEVQPDPCPAHVLSGLPIDTHPHRADIGQVHAQRNGRRGVDVGASVGHGVARLADQLREVEIRRLERHLLPSQAAGCLALVGRQLGLFGQGVFVDLGILRERHGTEHQPLANHAVGQGRARVVGRGFAGHERRPPTAVLVRPHVVGGLAAGYFPVPSPRQPTTPGGLPAAQVSRQPRIARLASAANSRCRFTGFILLRWDIRHKDRRTLARCPGPLGSGDVPLLEPMISRARPACRTAGTVPGRLEKSGAPIRKYDYHWPVDVVM